MASHEKLERCESLRFDCTISCFCNASQHPISPLLNHTRSRANLDQSPVNLACFGCCNLAHIWGPVSRNLRSISHVLGTCDLPQSRANLDQSRVFWMLYIALKGKPPKPHIVSKIGIPNIHHKRKAFKITR